MNRSRAGGDRLLASLAGFFTSTVAIVRATSAADDYGQPVPTWATVVGLTAIPALVVAGDVSIRMKRQEVRTTMAVTQMEYRRVMLKGYYPTVKRTDRVRIDAVDWAIVAIDHDPTATFTQLLLESLEPGNI